MKRSRRKFLMDATKIGVASGLMGNGILAFAEGELSRPLPHKKFGPNDSIRVGVIGTGGRGSGLIRNIKGIEGMDVVACCDILPFRLEKALEQAATGAKGYSNYKKLLEDNSLDAIILATPLYLHFEIAKDCLDAGKHLYCEKTMTFTIEETKKLEALVENASTHFQVGYQHRYNPLYQMVKDITEGEEFGTLSHIECYWNRNGDWRRPVPDPKLERIINWRMYREYSGGLMAELSSHQINIANWIIGSTPTRVTGFGGIDFWKDGRETYDNIHAIFDYPDGPKLSCTCLTTNAQMGFQMKLYGKNASISIVREEGYSAQLYVEPTYYYDLKKEKLGGIDGVTGATSKLMKMGKPISIHEADVGREDAEPTALCLASFGECIRENKTPLVGYESGKGSALCVALANKAMQSGEVVHWKDHV